MTTLFKAVVAAMLCIAGINVANAQGVCGGWSYVGSAQFTNINTNNGYMAIDGNGTIYVAYPDYLNSFKLTVKKFDGSNWVTVGAGGISSGSATATMAFDASNTPYIAYSDAGLARKGVCKKFDGTNWVGVGSVPFTAAAAVYTTVAVDASGNPWVGMQTTPSSKLSVLKYNGSSWVNVGTAGLSSGASTYVTLLFNSSGTPYVSYVDGGNSSKTYVMRYDGSSWSLVGGTPVSAGTSSYTAMALDHNGSPYVAYADGTNGNKLTVMRFDGTNWVSVGSTAFTSGAAITPSITIDSSNQPIVAFADGSISNNVTVLRFNGSNWSNLGNAGFASAPALYENIAMYNGVVYVAFGEGSDTRESVVKFAPAPCPITGSTSVCQNATITLGETATGGTWASKNNAIATVNNNGVVTGIFGGLDTITYTNYGQTVTYPIVVIASPTITLAANPTVISGATSTNIFYISSTGAPTTYSVVFDGAAHTAGFADVVNAPFTISHLGLSVPSNATPGTYHGTLTLNSATCTSTGYPVTLTVTSANTVPAFLLTSPQILSVCSGSTLPLNASLHITDAQASKTETFSQATAPAHGTLSFTGATATSGSNDITPGGAISYTPTSAFSGNDTFTVQVSDGTTTANMIVYVTVNPTPSITGATGKNICSNTSTIFNFAANTLSTFAWTLGTNTGGITGAASGSGYFIDQTLGNPSHLTAGSIIYNVTPTSVTGSCVGASSPITITVNPTPTVTTSATASICNGTSPVISLTASALSTFAWTLGTNTGSITGAAAGSGYLIDQTLGNSSTTTAGSIIYNVTPTSLTGSCAGTTTPITVTVNPTPAITGAIGKSICNGANTNFNFAASTASTFAWTLGVNTGGITGAVTGSGNVISQVLGNASNTTAGSVVYNVTPTSTTGSCVGAASAITITVNPTPAITGATGKSICNNTNTTFNFASSTPSNFAWTLGANTGGITGASTGSGLLIGETLGNPSNSAAGSVIYNVIPTSVTGSCVGASSPITITVNPTPVITTSATASICNGTSPAINLTATTLSSFAWTLGTNTGGITGATAGSGSSIGQVLGNPSNATAGSVVYNVTPTSVTGSCIGSAFLITVAVNPTPMVTGATGKSICNNTNSIFNLAASTASTFAWTLGTNTGGVTGASSGSGLVISQILGNPSNATAASIIYNVTPTATTGSCVGSATAITLTVNPTPAVTTAATTSICNGTSPAVNLTATAPSNFAWTLGTNNGGITGASAGSGAVINQALGNASNSTDGSVVYNVIPTSATGSCVGLTSAITIVVNPTPAVTTAIAKSICSGTSPAIALTASATSNFAWTLGTNTGGIIGALNTSASSIDQILNDPSNANPGSIIYTVTPTSVTGSCVGAPTDIMVTVNPTPTVTTTTSSSICDGTSPVITLTSSSPSSFAWTLGTNTGGITGSNAGTGSLIDQALGNPSNAIAGSIIYIVTPTATLGSCTGAATDMTVTVKPTPVVDPIPDQSVCNAVGVVSAINFTGSVSGAAYSWANTNSSIGLAANGSGNIVSFNGIDAGTTSTSGTVTVTPTAAGCIGIPQNFTITVRPTPNVVIPTGQVVCNKTPVAAMAFSGLVANTIYNWTNSDSTIGLSATGAGDIAGFTGSDTTHAPRTATINVTPVAAGCIGASQSNTVTVNPTPIVNIPGSETACNNTPVASVVFTGPVNGTTYTWTNPNLSIGLAANGIGNISSFIGTNPSTAIVTTTISVVPTANGCIGDTQNFTISVFPTPKLTSEKGDTLCSDVSFNYIPVSATTNVSYAWVRADVGHITQAGTTGTGPVSETLTNDTLGAVNVTYVYTLTANGCTNKESVTLRVNPIPPAPSIITHPLASMCSNVMYQNFGTANAPVVGEEFRWTASNAKIYAEGNTRQYATVNFPEAGPGNVVVTANMAGISCYSADTFAVNIGAGVAIQPDMVYHNSHFICLQSNMDSYQWGYDDNATADSTLLYGETNQNYYNTNPDFGGKNYWVITMQNGCIQKTYFNVPTAVNNVTVTMGDDIQVFPNPASQYINVEITTTGKNYNEVKVFDVLGKVYRTIPMIANKAKIDVSQLAAGIYLVGCYLDGVQVKAIRFVKN